jgi:2-polyprenyl-3-methyl-5-hydroxy-6-metoxy-1,4-benzoquinol methylase
MSQNDIHSGSPEIRDEIERILDQERCDSPATHWARFPADNEPAGGASGKRKSLLPVGGKWDMGSFKERVKRLPVAGEFLYWLVSVLRLGSLRQQLFSEQARTREQLQRQMQLLEDYVRGEIADKRLLRIHQELYDQLLHQVERNTAAQSWEQRLALLQERVNRLESTPAPHRTVEPSSASAASSSPERETSWDHFYWDLEARFRGDEATVLKGLEPYFTWVDRLETQLAAPWRAVDVGCGRGEWLNYLKSRHWDVCGIDSSERMVEACQAKGMQALRMDMLEGLAQQADGSLSLVSALHVVEHIPLETLFRFLDLAFQKLRPGGMLILETPNPDNLRVGASNFYIDPTHVRPIPSLLLQFVVGHRGFLKPEVLPLHPYPAEHGSQALDPTALLLNHYLFGPQDYAIIAFKP